MGFDGGGARYTRGRALVVVVTVLLAAVPGSRGLTNVEQNHTALGRARPDDNFGMLDVEGAASSQRSRSMSEQHQIPMSIFNITAGRAPKAVPLPKFINSASEHGESPETLDWILISVCLVSPALIWGVIRIWEGLNATSKHVPAIRPERRPRIGSLYRLQEQSSGSMTPVSMLMQAFESDSAEGTALQNVLAGFTTALTVIPNTVSFSFITETSPVNGLWACAFMSISTSLVGGRPGMVSGVSAATAVVLANVSTADDMGGTGPMALCVFSAGLLQMFMGLLKISRLMTLIPLPVMLGFINGLAVVMFRSQLRHFHEFGDGSYVSYGTYVGMMATAGVAMFVAMSLKKGGMQAMPVALASICITSCFAFFVDKMLPCRTLGDVAGPGVLQIGFRQIPKWDFPPTGMEWNNHGIVLKVINTSVRLALVGLLESLMAEALVDQITGTCGSMRRECFGQGFGNVLAALFGTQGGCALLGHSLLNISSGGRSRLSGVAAGFTFILSAMVLSPVITAIPVAPIMGIMTLVAMNTFAWGTFRLILRINWIDFTVVAIVMVMTIWGDIVVAIFMGVLFSGLGFAWRIATEARVETEAGKDRRTFFLIGPLFFGSAMNYQKEMNPLMITESLVVLDFSKCRILDISGVDAINKTREFLISHGKRVFLKAVPREVLQFLPKDAEYETLPQAEVAEGGTLHFKV